MIDFPPQAYRSYGQNFQWRRCYCPKIQFSRMQDELNKKDKVMTLTALSREFSYSEFERLNISSSYRKMIRHNFYNDGLMKRTYSKNGLKGIRLTNRGKEKLKQKYLERFGHIADKNRTELRVSYMINGTFLNIKNTSNAIFLVSDFEQSEEY